MGSGAGFDIFLAAEKVGAAGKAIGIDMNKVRTIELSQFDCGSEHDGSDVTHRTCWQRPARI